MFDKLCHVEQFSREILKTRVATFIADMDGEGVCESHRARVYFYFMK